ncbi:MAG: lipid-A-disaccharide synthase [Nitrospinota bacterium]
MSWDLWLMAGEASGDLHGGRLAEALLQRRAGLRIGGVGGARMRAAGVRTWFDVAELSVVGFAGVGAVLPRLFRIYRRVRASLEREPPRVLVLVDYPGFHLLLARTASRRGVRVVYFIPPQVWAWWPGRAKTLARCTRKVLTIFPFEEPLLRGEGVDAEYVGNPVAFSLRSAPAREEARRTLGLPEGGTVVSLLPGSRPRELRDLLPVLVGAASRIREEMPETRFLLPAAPSLGAARVRSALGDSMPWLRVTEGGAPEALRASDVALVSSGTATLEAALLGTPMVVAYKVGAVTHFIGRHFLARVNHISLANLLCGKGVVPELIEGEARPERVAEEALSLLTNGERAARMREELSAVGPLLGTGDPFGRAADRVLEVVEEGRL